MIAKHVPVKFAISGHHHRALRSHLFPGDGNEAVAFAICGRARRSEMDLLVVHDIVPIPYEACRIRTPYTVIWSGEAMESILKLASKKGMFVAKIHSHPNGYPWFSETDDIADDSMFPSIFGWLDIGGPLASLIMFPDGRLVGRAIRDEGRGEPLECIRLVGDDFVFWRQDNDEEEVPDHASRIKQTFGETTYRQLRKMRVGVVGASGTGSIVIEQLARNCVGELVIIDSDHVEDKNLNRILNSTAQDAFEKVKKPFVQERAIQAMKLGTKVLPFDKDLMNREVLEVLSSCDVLFGCMDSVDGRHLLNKLASTYVIPLIDLGVRLDADGQGGIESIWAAIHVVLPGGSSLLSRGVYSQPQLEAAFLKRTNPEAYEEQRKVGYIQGVPVDSPAVISVNMDAASAAVNEFLARIHPYRVKANKYFAARRISLSDPDASYCESDGKPCPVFNREVGKGDQSPFLGMPLLATES